MLASYNSNVKNTRMLLEQGAEIDAGNGGGMTPLMFAAMVGRSKEVAQLQAHGASLQRRNRLGFSASFMVRVSRWMARRFQDSEMARPW